eukprot:scaffold7348_cov113-Isochrysis_galbana.AAC.4
MRARAVLGVLEGLVARRPAAGRIDADWAQLVAQARVRCLGRQPQPRVQPLGHPRRLVVVIALEPRDPRLALARRALAFCPCLGQSRRLPVAGILLPRLTLCLILRLFVKQDAFIQRRLHLVRIDTQAGVGELSLAEHAFDDDVRAVLRAAHAPRLHGRPCGSGGLRTAGNATRLLRGGLRRQLFF